MSIEVRNITKRFGGFVALDDVSVHVPDGSLTGLLGPSGGGKSTLLRVIAGLEAPDAGEVLIAGADTAGVPTRRRGVGFVFQHYAAFKHMTVADNVAFGLTVRKRPKAQTRARVAELLDLVGLGPLGTRYPDQLSGGQRQRMALARALAVEPRLLLLDEPFGALDARVRAELRDWLRRLHDEVHVTTVFVTHDQEEALEISDQVVVMSQGRVEQAGPPSALYDAPANEFVMQSTGPVTRLGAELVRPHDVEILAAANGHTPDGAVAAVVERVARLGFEVRAVLCPEDGSARLHAQLTRAQADGLALAAGQRVHVRAARAPAFA